MEQPSFSSLASYSLACGVCFLLTSLAFCVYKNYRTLPISGLPRASASILLPALPEADLSLRHLFLLVYGYSDRTLREDVKVEGWIYVQFHRDLMRICLVMCVVGITVLVPTYVGGTSGSEAWGLGRFDMTNIRDRERLLWVSIAVLVLFTTLLTCFMFDFRSRIHTELLKADGGVAARSLKISHLPANREIQSLSELLHTVLSVQLTQPPHSLDPIEVVSVVPDLNLAYSLFLQLKRALKVRMHFLELEEVQRKTVLMNKGLCKKRPAVEYYNAKVAALQEQYKDTMKVHQLSLGVAFVTFRTRKLMLELHQKFKWKLAPAELTPEKWKISKAPNPKEILWENLTKPKTHKQLLANAVFIVVFFVVLTPVAFEKYVLKALAILHLSEIVQSFLTPILIYAYQQVVLLQLVRILVKIENHTRSSHASVSAFYKFYLFSFVYSYLLPMLGITTLHIILHWFASHDHNWAELLSASVRLSGFTFTNVVVSHCFVSNGMELLQHSKYISAVFRAAKAKLPDDRVRAFEAEDFPFGLCYADSLLVLLLVASYAIVYPMILPFGLLYFALRKYNLLCFYVVRFDSFGEVARHVSAAIAVAVFAMQVQTGFVAMLSGKMEFYIAGWGCMLLACVQLPVSLIAARRYQVSDEELPASHLLTEPVEQSYLHPCLRPAPG